MGSSCFPDQRLRGNDLRNEKDRVSPSERANEYSKLRYNLILHNYLLQENAEERIDGTFTYVHSSTHTFVLLIVRPDIRASFSCRPPPKNIRERKRQLSKSSFVNPLKRDIHRVEQPKRVECAVDTKCVLKVGLTLDDYYDYIIFYVSIA